MTIIRSVEALRAVYGTPNENSLIKETDRVIAQYAAYIRASPFLTIATSGPGGIDCSPRGDRPGFVRVIDENTLHMPDRLGNNRLDSIENIVADGRVGLCFLVPGSGTTLRVNGRAEISVDPALCNSFAESGKPPRSVIVIHVESVYFQCSRAIIRAGLWNGASQVDPADLPSPGDMLKAARKGDFDAQAYDREWPARAMESLW